MAKLSDFKSLLVNACKVLLSTPYRTLHTSISWLEFSRCDLKSALKSGSLCLPTCSYAWKQEFLICLLKAFISEKVGIEIVCRTYRCSHLSSWIPICIFCLGIFLIIYSYIYSTYKYFSEIMSMYTIACRFG